MRELERETASVFRSEKPRAKACGASLNYIGRKVIEILHDVVIK